MSNTQMVTSSFKNDERLLSLFFSVLINAYNCCTKITWPSSYRVLWKLSSVSYKSYQHTYLQHQLRVHMWTFHRCILHTLGRLSHSDMNPWHTEHRAPRHFLNMYQGYISLEQKLIIDCLKWKTTTSTNNAKGLIWTIHQIYNEAS